MAQSIPLRKLAIELRYKPHLGFYSKMDDIALRLSDEFPDWERSPLTVEIRNKKKHRRIFLAHRRCFYEGDLLPNQLPNSEFDFAIGRLERVISEMDVKEFTRIGVRQWVAADLGKAFALMVDEIGSRFHNQSEQLAGIVRDKVADLAYVVDCETSEGWKYHLRLGPMTREEWFQRVSYQKGGFEQSTTDATAMPSTPGPSDNKEAEKSTDADAATLQHFRETIPANLLCLDVDCYQEGIPASDLKSHITTFRRRSHELIGQLIEYSRG